MALRAAIGKALHELPQPMHRILPPRARSALRRRLGQYGPWEFEFDRPPPEPAPGEITGPPDFVGIGAQRSGTTWWYSLIAGHPQSRSLETSVARDPVAKERHYFDRFATLAFGAAEVAEYHRWFPRAPGQLVGEWTPDYVAFPWVPALLARAAPRTKLLVMVRDPVERFCSGLTHSISHGAGRDGVTVDANIEHGFYARCLQQWLAHFPKEQLLVLQYETCVAEPGSQLALTYRYLGLDAGYTPPQLTLPVNATPSAKEELPPDARERLAAVYADDVDALFTAFPDLDRSRWRNFASSRVGR